MIELNDAIERVKLAADESGIISNYTYDQIVEQLAEEDKYAFTMALVDLGLRTKQGSSKAEEEMQKILAKDLESVNVDRQVDIVEDFVRVAQQFTQQPSGLWVPETTQEEEEPVEEAPVEPEGYESFLESTPFVWPQRDQYSDQEMMQAVPDPAFAPDVPVEQIVQTLEEAGIYVDSNGNVTLYQQGVPGLYTQQIPLKPMPLETAIQRINTEANNIDQEQTRIESLQDILSSLNSDFSEIQMDAQNLLDKFDDSYNNLEQFRYSEQSPDENIRAIAENLAQVRTYIEQSYPEVDEMRGGLGQYAGTITDLQGQLDQYFQTQYDKYDQKLEVVNALEQLKSLQESSPEAFQDAVSGIGGVAASRFLEWNGGI